jgi:hypothetical protein
MQSRDPSSLYTAKVQKRILLVQQTLQPPGGASAVTAWMLEALKNEYDLTVLAFERVDLAAINRFYGTSLSDSDLSVIYPHRFAQAMLRWDFTAGSIQPLAWMMRMCHRLRQQFDLTMAAGMEELDLGGPGLLYIRNSSGG